MSGICDDMCDVLYDVMLYYNVVQSFVVERHKVNKDFLNGVEEDQKH